jgi:hypothetical protein
MSNIEALPSATSRRVLRGVLRGALRNPLRNPLRALQELSNNIQTEFNRFQQKGGSRAVRYWLADLDAYWDSQVRHSTSDPGGAR